MPTNVYIAPFTSRSGIDKDVLSSLRDQFEESFEQTFGSKGAYEILNRQTVEKILAEAGNEEALTSVGEIKPKAEDDLRLAKANGVIFGEVTDDKVSGEVIVSVKLQSFDSHFFWNHSVAMTRGKIYDFSSRKAAMEQLVASIDAPLKAATGSAQPHGATTSATSSSNSHHIGDKLKICEQTMAVPPIKVCGVLTWNGEKYDEIIPGTAFTATVTAQRGQGNTVSMSRVDITFDPGVTATYFGTISQDNKASGTVSWYFNGNPVGAGTWTIEPLAP